MASAGPLVIGFGNTLIDATVSRTAEQAAEWGLVPGDAILASERHIPLIEEVLSDPGCVKTVGDTIQNAICAAQWLLPPGSTAMVGAIGGEGDAVGAELVQMMEAAGVAHYYQRLEGERTGVCACLVGAEQSSWCALIGAAGKFQYSTWDTPEVVQLFDTARVCVVSGYFLESTQQTAQAVLNYCLGVGVPLAFSVSYPECICNNWGPTFRTLLRFAAFVIGNEDAIPCVAEKLGVAGVEGIATYGGRSRTVVCTRAAQSTLVSDGGPAFEVPVIPIADNDFVDSTGAGDAFVGGFLAGFVSGVDLVQCVRAGHFAAHATLRGKGCALPATRAEFAFVTPPEEGCGLVASLDP